MTYLHSDFYIQYITKKIFLYHCTRRVQWRVTIFFHMFFSPVGPVRMWYGTTCWRKTRLTPGTSTWWRTILICSPRWGQFFWIGSWRYDCSVTTPLFPNIYHFFKLGKKTTKNPHTWVLNIFVLVVNNGLQFLMTHINLTLRTSRGRDTPLCHHALRTSGQN